MVRTAYFTLFSARHLCLLNFGPGDRSFIIALDKKTGHTVWKFDIPIISSSVDARELGGPDTNVFKGATARLSEIAGSWATPLIVPAIQHWSLLAAAGRSCFFHKKIKFFVIFWPELPYEGTESENSFSCERREVLAQK